jgi:hypothetical protein
MHVVKLRLKKRNGHWNVGDLVLEPGNLESESFDLDAVDPRMQTTINRGANVFKLIEIVDCEGPPEFVLGLPEEATPFGPAPRVEKPEIVGGSSPPEEAPLLVDDSWREDARGYLEKSISKIKGFVGRWPKNPEIRQKIMFLIEEERAGKSRKTLLKFLEDAFLSIPPGVE